MYASCRDGKRILKEVWAEKPCKIRPCRQWSTFVNGQNQACPSRECRIHPSKHLHSRTQCPTLSLLAAAMHGLSDSSTTFIPNPGADYQSYGYYLWLLVKAMIFPVVMYGCQSWTIKKAEHWRIDAFELWCWEKTLESPLDCKEIQPVHPKGDQSWVFIGRTDAEAETPIIWPPHAQSWLIGKDPDTGRDWGQEKGMTEDEIAGCHHQLNGHEFE